MNLLGDNLFRDTGQPVLKWVDRFKNQYAKLTRFKAGSPVLKPGAGNWISQQCIDSEILMSMQQIKITTSAHKKQI